MQTLIQYAKSMGAIKLETVDGPNGRFISLIKADNTKTTLPVGKKSQHSALSEYKILIADDGGVIVTANEYEVSESMAL